MRIAAPILLIFLFTRSFGQICEVKGRVLDLTTKKPLKGAEVMLLNRVSKSHDSCEFFWRKIYSMSGILLTGPSETEKVSKRVFTDKDGFFRFNNIDTPYRIICSYKVIRPNNSFLAYHDDLRYTDSLQITENEAKGLYFIKATCLFDNTSILKYCPTCKKRDNIQPILWGLPVVGLDGYIRDDKGKIVEDYYAGGCEPDPWCNPMKYCKRCKLKF